MVEMVSLLFARIGKLPQNALGPTTTHSIAHSPRLHVNPDISFAPGNPPPFLSLPRRLLQVADHLCISMLSLSGHLHRACL